MENLSEYLTTISDRLRARGHRMTPQRMAILRAILESPTHPTAEEIYRQVSADFPMLSLATVYKTLHVLKELGATRELTVDGISRYDRNLPPHPHLVCVRCQAVIDLPPEMMVTLPEEALAGYGFHPLWYEVSVYGLCSRCLEAKK